ncbi:MAG: hypothetical protein JWN78_1692 [Bacteroidota bacterium]|nr:hypothetical protein [Bacteroidota bacterium]
MKKKMTLGVLFTAIALSLGLTSCKKVRTCSCANGYSFSIPSGKKSDQKKVCDAAATGLQTSCTLK